MTCALPPTHGAMPSSLTLSSSVHQTHSLTVCLHTTESLTPSLLMSLRRGGPIILWLMPNMALLILNRPRRATPLASTTRSSSSTCRGELMRREGREAELADEPVGHGVELHDGRGLAPKPIGVERRKDIHIDVVEGLEGLLRCVGVVEVEGDALVVLKPLAHPSGDVESGHGKEVPVLGVLPRLDHQLPGHRRVPSREEHEVLQAQNAEATEVGSRVRPLEPQLLPLLRDPPRPLHTGLQQPPQLVQQGLVVGVVGGVTHVTPICNEVGCSSDVPEGLAVPLQTDAEPLWVSRALDSEHLVNHLLQVFLLFADEQLLRHVMQLPRRPQRLLHTNRVKRL
mmetsp:Transcript_3681/g.9155  ORF Transcript_3681/g.9155 Transcript_3681/m.9155 type:complete len:340 (-) Transcript_3681:146-1165(-)